MKIISTFINDIFFLIEKFIKVKEKSKSKYPHTPRDMTRASLKLPKEEKEYPSNYRNENNHYPKKLKLTSFLIQGKSKLILAM